MGHFSAAVITKSEKSISDILEQFDENLRLPTYVKHTKEEVIANGKKSIERLKVWGLYADYISDPEKYKEDHKGNEVMLNHVINDIPKRFLWTDDEIYAYETEDINPEEIGPSGEILSTHNPNSKWDWFQIGGRWDGMLILHNGQRVSEAAIKNIDWEIMKREKLKNLRPYNEFISDNYIPSDLILKRYPTEEIYINSMIEFSTFAVVTPDTFEVWHESGKMGWFGMSSATDNESIAWIKNYSDKFIKNAPEDSIITIVDCHI